MNASVMQQDNWAASLNHNQAKALSLLGQGISAVMVASTLGISESLVSQYISDKRFSEEVTKLKLAGLQAQTDIDNKYMKAETQLLDKLIKTIPLISKPMDILRGLQVVNATKRRGMAEGASVAQHTNIVQINLPAVMAARFVTNTANQIVEIQDEQGARSLVTSTTDAVSRYAIEAAGEQGLGATAGTERLPETIDGVSWENIASTEDRIKQASALLSKLAVKEPSRERQVSSSSFKGQITADDL